MCRFDAQVMLPDVSQVLVPSFAARESEIMSFETPGNSNQLIQRHIQDGLNPLK
jgi:hypothetical protein